MTLRKANKEIGGLSGHTPLAAAVFLIVLQQQQKNFLNPGIIELTYQKTPQNCTIIRMMHRTAFSVAKAKTRIRTKDARITIVAIRRSLSNIFLIWDLNPARKNVLSPPQSLIREKRRLCDLPSKCQSETHNVGDEEPHDAVVGLSRVLETHAANKHQNQTYRAQDIELEHAGPPLTEDEHS